MEIVADSTKSDMRRSELSTTRAYSKVVLRGIRIAEAGVRFPLGPPKKRAAACLLLFSLGQ